MSDDLKERLRANHLDECYEAIDRIEELEVKLAKYVKACSDLSQQHISEWGRAAELEVKLAGLAWQPMETAPRDTMRSILLHTPEGVQIGWWSEGQDEWLTEEGKYLWADPTLWMPIPIAELKGGKDE